MRWLERLAIVVAALVIAVVLIVVMSGGPLAGRDDPGISGPGPQLGVPYPDLGHAHLQPGAKPPAYNSDPPTSGAHVPVPITRDGTELSDDQLLQALEVGNVVVAYGSSRAPAGLRRLAADVAAPFTPALAAAGQAVILARRPGTNGLLALAWTHLLRVDSVQDPRLRGFILYWLGRGAPPG
jgi:hypothetical protein